MTYFDGALADAPASARPEINSDPETIARTPIAVSRDVRIPASISNNSDDSVRRLVVPKQNDDPKDREAQ